MNRLSTDRTGTARRKATNLSLREDLVTQARELGINVSQACETGLAEAVSQARALRWQEENREAIEGYNAYIEANGLPLERFRQF